MISNDGIIDYADVYCYQVFQQKNIFKSAISIHLLLNDPT